MKITGYCPVLTCLLAGRYFSTINAFTARICQRPQATQLPTTFRKGPLYFFGNREKNEVEKDQYEENEGSDRKLPFFTRLLKQREETKKEEAVKTVEQSEESTQPKPTQKVVKLWEKEEPQKSQNPTELAKMYRAQAERARLEAERMDVELTLQKIEKLERQFVLAKTKGESVEDLQLQLDNLQAKLRGEPPKGYVAAKADRKKKPEGAVGQSKTPPSETPTVSIEMDFSGQEMDFSGKEIDEVSEIIDNAPGLLKKIMAAMVEVDFDDASTINTTEVAKRMIMASNQNYSYSKKPKPFFFGI